LAVAVAEGKAHKRRLQGFKKKSKTKPKTQRRLSHVQAGKEGRHNQPDSKQEM
jgi:hypothetical protein